MTPMADSRSYKRRIYLINREFQFAYVGKILMLEFAAVAVTALLMSYLFLFVFNDAAMVSAGPWGRGILWSTLGLIVVLVAILIWLGIRVSHRIAGPMFRFEKSFNDITAGNTALRVYLREKDEMKPVAVAFNQMMDSLVSRLGDVPVAPAVKTPLTDLGELLRAIASSEMPASDKDKYRKILEGLRERLASKKNAPSDDDATGS
ncbi:MAG: HAMP domain-containing protein [Myxococcales bacterium]|nr:MAG: HAMP domain-containing protein [Myxococcales bacterium]